MPNYLGCHVYRDVEQADSLCLVEAWATQVDVDTYMQWEDWRVIQGATKLLGVTGQVQFCTVTQTEGIDRPPD